VIIKYFKMNTLHIYRHGALATPASGLTSVSIFRPLDLNLIIYV